MTASFDIKRDIEIVNAGGFFCQACIVGKPLDDQSPDPRYCQGCYEILLDEASLLPAKVRKPGWIPLADKKIALKKDAVVSQHGTQIMSTVNDKKIEVDIIQPPPHKVTHGKRGPKFTELPEDLIKDLAGQGLGSKAISSELVKQGYSVSYKTIQRRLQGVLI